MAAAGEAEDDGTCRGRRLARELCGPRTLVAKALVAQGRRFLGSGGRVRVEHAFERKWRAARVVVEIARAQSGSHACDSRRTRRRWCRTLRVARSELSSARSSPPARDGRRAHRGVRARGPPRSRASHVRGPDRSLPRPARSRADGATAAARALTPRATAPPAARSMTGQTFRVLLWLPKFMKLRRQEHDCCGFPPGLMEKDKKTALIDPDKKSIFITKAR